MWQFFSWCWKCLGKGLDSLKENKIHDGCCADLKRLYTKDPNHNSENLQWGVKSGEKQGRRLICFFQSGACYRERRFKMLLQSMNTTLDLIHQSAVWFLQSFTKILTFTKDFLRVTFEKSKNQRSSLRHSSTLICHSNGWHHMVHHI